jgi:hypothetical protein
VRDVYNTRHTAKRLRFAQKERIVRGDFSQGKRDDISLRTA